MGMFRDFLRAIFRQRASFTIKVNPESNVLVPSPLTIAKDDPLMREASMKAKNSVALLRTIFEERPKDTYIKIPFTTNSGHVEHVWAKLLRLEAKAFSAQILTAPAQHRGPLPVPYEGSIDDLEDWQVEMPDGHIRGGFSMRVMFLRAKQHYGERVPADLETQMERYVDA